MLCLKFNLIYNKAAVSSLNRKFQTHSALSIRKKQEAINKEDLGIRHLKKSFEDDEEYLKTLSCDGDPEDIGAVDFFQVDKSYDEHKREKKWKRELLARQIAKHKFFKPRPQPPMLTWSERQYMKYLHEKDPDQWNIFTLSESFPATVDVVKKVLSSKTIYSPTDKERLDRRVQKNWKLLATNKLEADPKLIEHCKKFVNCRQILLDQAKNQDFYLPKIKEEKVYNCGEMSNIIADYEKSVNQMLEKDKVLLGDGKNIKNSNSNINKSNIELLHEKIEEERKTRDLEGQETFNLNRSIKYDNRKQLTFDAVQENILRKAEQGKNLSLLENAILESTINQTSNKNNTTKVELENKVKDSLHLKFELNQTSYESSVRKSELKNEIQDTQNLKYDLGNTKTRKLVRESVRKRNEFRDIEFNSSFTESYQSGDEKELINKNDFDEFCSEMPPPGNTKVVQECDVGKVLKFSENNVTFHIKNEKETPEVTKKERKPRHVKSVESGQITDTGASFDIHKIKESNNFECSDDLLLNSIKCNQLFQSTQTSNLEEDVSLVARTQQTPGDEVLFHLEDKDNIKKIQKNVNTFPETQRKESHISNTKPQPGVLFEDHYPERITIPKEKRNLGSLFKVKDCYYDTDGRFLYKVPGMTK